MTEVGAERLCTHWERFLVAEKCALILATYGGDPSAAYRIARRIQKLYSTRGQGLISPPVLRILCFVPTSCKSAGNYRYFGRR